MDQLFPPSIIEVDLSFDFDQNNLNIEIVEPLIQTIDICICNKYRCYTKCLPIPMPDGIMDIYLQVQTSAMENI